MGEMVGDGAKFTCTLCDSEIELEVSESSTTGSGKKIATESNHKFIPAPLCKIVPQSPPPCAPAVAITDPGQSPVSIDGSQALGKECQGVCMRGGSLALSDPAQEVFQHN
ncbi:MAG: PAAR-like protein [Candidatus Algichlamydia australiensis]|nr:PAAR-like protein [Chlamydiales bacterium]